MSGTPQPPRPPYRRVPPPAAVTPATPARPATSAPANAPGAAEPRRAVAVTYDPTHAGAPVITAVGEGAVAEEIIRGAHEAGVTVTEDAKLATVLSQIDVGEMIPPELYTVVAEVLAYVYQLEERVTRRQATRRALQPR
jgi:flagellar biosynthesis protein